MTPEATPARLVAAAIAYLVALSIGISMVSYDLWGAFVVLPPMVLLTWVGVRRMFTGSLESLIAPMMVGFGVKVLGGIARFVVAFDAYNGSTDAQRYHVYAKNAAGAFWYGGANFSSVMPGGTGTTFVERTTSFVYTLIGSSKLAGFFVFGWVGFWGLAMFVKAACIAVPGLAQRRYAYLCMLAPSLVYWPSSIGKEALLIGALGLTSLGMARLLTGGRTFAPALVIAVGAVATGVVRAHLAGIWLGAFVPAALVAIGVVTRRRSRQRNARGPATSSANPWLLVGLVAAFAAMTFAVGRVAVDAIVASDEQTSIGTGIADVLRETTRRSGQGGSNFSPLVVSSPVEWPYAVARTLTRPLLIEAKGLFQFLSAFEMTLYLALLAGSWRRLRTLPRRMVTMPYVTLATTVLFMGGLAYASFANLGILTRQKSLLIPFMLLLPCLPARRANTDARPVTREYGVGVPEFAGTDRGR